MHDLEWTFFGLDGKQLSFDSCLQSWIEEMVPYVKSLDANHLLTIGEEGFYSSADSARSNFANPQGSNTCGLGLTCSLLQCLQGASMYSCICS